MPATAPHPPARKDRQRLLTSCAIAAGLAALAHGGAALAQVAGNGSFASGAGTIGNDSGTNTTTVNVGTSESVINWVPTDTAPTGGAIDVLPAGENLDFIGTGDYTVLNRFVDGSGGALSRQIALNGTVNAYVGSTSGPRGGNIWFYNAGGILIGASGVLNVGSLLLTSNDIDTTGGLFGPGGTIRLAGASGSTSAITVNGAINAGYDDAPGSAYVALVAPRIVQAGNVRVDGSAAYVAAEAANIRINGGLFDIDVTVGAEGGTVITHTGTTTGPAHLDTNGNQSRVYMVAIPKNDAVTMLVGGAIGYDDAISAQIDPDGAVRLSAGFDIVGGELAFDPENATAANIAAADTLFRSDTIARASGTFTAAPTQTIPGSPPPLSSAGQFFVEGNGSFTGDAGASLTIGAGQLAGASGDFTLDASNGGANGSAALTVNGGSFAAGSLALIASGAVDAATGDISGGTASLTITGGTLSASTVSVEANGLAEGGIGTTSAAGTGGTASFSQSGGTVSVGDLSVTADGAGGIVDGQSGLGTGGSATIDISGGTLTVSDITASASGEGGVGSSGNDENPLNIIPGGLGGQGRGGTATINISGTAVVDATAIQASAIGTGGRGGEFFNFSSFGGVPGTPGNGAEGVGGNAAINVAGGTTAASSMVADASGIGGDGGGSFFSSSSGGATGVGVGGTGGTGRGGTATIALEAAIPDVISASSIATGTGGDGGTHNVGGAGGDGFGGVAQTIVTGFEAGELAVTIDSTGTGGNGGNANDGDGGSGGNGTGGTSRLQAVGAGAGVTALETNFVTDGVGGNGGSGGLGFGSFPTIAPDGGDGGNGVGGTLEIAANDGAAVTLGLGSGSSIALGSTGRGGAGGTGENSVFGSGNQAGNGGDGGTGSGGTVRLVAAGGTIGSGGEAVDFTANGVAGEGGSGGIGQGGGTDGALGAMGITAGGRVEIGADSGTAAGGQIDLGPTTIDASGDTAGRVELRVNGGDINFAGLSAQAFGLAAPTNNDTATASTGIFVSVAGGTIAGQGDVALTTDGSIGVYGASNGSFDVDGSLTLDAGDQIDLRHDNRVGTAPTLSASNLAMAAVTSISGAAGSLAAADGALSLAVSGPTGTIAVDGLAGGNIAISSPGAATVEHAEAAGDFIANVGSLATGLNSIITGGNIDISASGAVDLGNSTAGGFVQVSGQSIAFNSIDAGLTVNLSAIDGIIGGAVNAGGDITMFAGSVALTGPVTGDASFFAFGIDGAVSVDDADVAGTISIFAANDLTGNFVAGGDIFLNSDANIAASAVANGGYVDPNGIGTAGNLFVIAAGDASLTSSAAARMFGVSADGAASINGGTAGEDMLVLAGTTASLANSTAGDDVTVQAAGNITADGVAATGTGADTHVLGFSNTSGSPIFTITAQAADGADVVIESTTAAIDGTSIAGQDVTLTGATGIGVDQVTALGATSLDSSDGNIRIGALFALGPIDASANAIRIESGGDMAFQTLTTDVGDAFVRASGDLSLASGSVAGTADLATQGTAMTITALTAANATLAGNGGVLNLDTVTVAGDLGASALSSLGITGIVTGQAISLASADIVIGSAGRVGTAGVTTALSVANNDDGNQTFIGGAPGGSVAGYHLDADELTRLYSAQIEVFAPEVASAGSSSVGSAAPPDVIIDSFTLAGGSAGSTLGANGALTIRTPGKMRVIGNVELTGLTDTNALNLVATDALEVILGQGSVRLVNGTAAAGQLNLVSDDIIVATAEAIADVGAATTTDAINTRLAENDGVVLDEGALFARGIRAEVVGGFYVQNSGTGTELSQRRGLTFGTGGLDVVTAGPSRIVINGVHLGPSGQVTGLEALQLVTVNGVAPAPGAYDPRSTVNGCLLSSPTVCTTISFDGDGGFPVQDVIEEEIEADEDGPGEGNSLPQALITMRDVDPLSGEPLVDDPVTGAGNDDLWTPPAE
ncbi:beta strand repeat-containing protein [Sphingopyxis kveilinensis]|uniref:beta strand repeat-containing protein n=1 Tax=Sphingopyxis kveilinensis TaxID=3114367 RepID=UPI0030D57F61